MPLPDDYVHRFPLHAAVRQPDRLRRDDLAVLLASHDPNGADANGLTPLMAAVISDRPDVPLPGPCLELLLQHADPRVRQSTQGNTALLYATRHATVPTVQALLPLSDVRHRNHLGQDLLYGAAHNPNDPGMVATVLPWADPLQRYPMNDRQTPLMVALQCGTVEGIRTLVGVSDLTVVDAQGFSPLSLAARNSPPHLLLALLDHPALTRHPEHLEDGWSALMLAQLNHHLRGNSRALLDVTKRLLELGFRADLENVDGMTALDLLLERMPTHEVPDAWAMAGHLALAMPAAQALGVLRRGCPDADRARPLIEALIVNEKNVLQAVIGTSLDAPAPRRARL